MGEGNKATRQRVNEATRQEGNEMLGNKTVKQKYDDTKGSLSIRFSLIARFFSLGALSPYYLVASSTHHLIAFSSTNLAT